MTTRDYVTTEEIESWCYHPKCRQHKLIVCRNGRQLDFCKEYDVFCFVAIKFCREMEEKKRPAEKTQRQTKFKVE